MMILLIFIAIPCLVAAGNYCEDGKLACPAGKVCCEVDGQQQCCDPGSIYASQEKDGNDIKAVAAAPAHLYRNTSNGKDMQQHASSTTCAGIYCDTLHTCCLGVFCCPVFNAYCCDSSTCCENGFRCCPNMQRICCPVNSVCCRGGDSEWCCMGKNSRCGIRSFTCFAAGATFTPTITYLALLFLFTLTSKKYFL